MLATPSPDCTAFLVEGAEAGLVAFAEAALRRDHVHGCDTTPVAFLEGIFVHPDYRNRGLGTRLLQAVQGWAREAGCTELASDADLANRTSQVFHAARGFQETGRVVFFRMPL